LAAELKIYSDSACTAELSGTPYELDLGELDGTNGETYTTSVLVKNTGADTAGVVTLTETSDTDSRGSYSLDDITYSTSSLSLGTLAAGASIRVYIKVVVAAATDTQLDEALNFTVAGTGTSKSVEATYTVSTILDAIKTTLRISGTDTDSEIEDLILAVKADLQLSGLLGEKILVTDALIKRAIVVYCKANYGWDNPEADRFEKSYQMLKNHMSLSRDYAFYAVTFTVVDSDGAAIDEAEIVFDGTTKYTNTSGIAVFYVRAGDNYEYQITHEDYADYVDSDGEWYNVDISASTAISITMSDS
jgi:hypothetical protein